MHTLGYYLGQTWRSIVSFFLSFFLLGLMVWFTPDWVNSFVKLAGDLKFVLMDAFDAIFGYGQPAALFSLVVGDTAIALTIMTLFTRVVVLTLIMWLGGLMFREAPRNVTRPDTAGDLLPIAA
ncbi:MAG: hypothetical protein ABL973_02975 [Micropepsaceae bacterium]